MGPSLSAFLNCGPLTECSPGAMAQLLGGPNCFLRHLKLASGRHQAPLLLLYTPSLAHSIPLHEPTGSLTAHRCPALLHSLTLHSLCSALSRSFYSGPCLPGLPGGGRALAPASSLKHIETCTYTNILVLASLQTHNTHTHPRAQPAWTAWRRALALTSAPTAAPPTLGPLMP